MKILAIGDVCGEIGQAALAVSLPELCRKYEPDLVIVNGENADGVGIRPAQAERIFNAGAHVITLGNHTFNRNYIVPLLDSDKRLLRPLNYTDHAPGHGFLVLERCGVTVGVMSLIGRCELDFNADNPFLVAEKQLQAAKVDVVIVDFHAEATSEKAAMAYFLDGHAAVLFGTHTHVQTCDERLFPQGLGFITDIGMTGAYDSVIGVRAHQSLGRFLGQVPERYETPTSGATVTEGALFTVDEKSKACTAIERIRVFGEIE